MVSYTERMLSGRMNVLGIALGQQAAKLIANTR